MQNFRQQTLREVIDTLKNSGTAHGQTWVAKDYSKAQLIADLEREQSLQEAERNGE